MADENPYKSPEADTVAEEGGSTSDDRATATVVPVSKRYYGIGLLIGVFACGFFAFILLVSDSGPRATTTLIEIFVAGLVAFFFVWFSVCGAYFLYPTAYGLTINETGVHERYAIGGTFIPWSNVLSIEMAEVEGGSMIAFSLRERPTWVFNLGRYDYYLANYYAIPKNELFSLLRARHARYVLN